MVRYRNFKFPSDFLWGSGAAAHQIEGGNHNDWSEWEKIPGNIIDGTNASVACDHYNRYEEDFDLVKELGHQVHRFSIEWSRVEPSQGKWNEKEIDHYCAVTKALIDRDIKPMITLHHFTNPIWFSDLDSWVNPESPEIFAPFCRKVTEALSEYDVIWNTVNEPIVVAKYAYLYGEMPPQRTDYEQFVAVAKHLLKAHGQAATQVREVYEEKGLEQPMIAPVISADYFMPADPSSEEDIKLAEYLDNIHNQVWLKGVATGTIPEPFGDGAKYEPLRNSADFIGVNYYCRMLASSKCDWLAGELPEKTIEERCDGLNWEVYPEGYYHLLKSFWDQWKIPIFLTENGIGTLDDSLKRRYLLKHLQQVHRAIEEGVDVLGYLIWSFTDNFEWTYGFSSRFGIVELDIDTLERTPRESAYMYQEIIRNNCITKDIQKRYPSK